MKKLFEILYESFSAKRFTSTHRKRLKHKAPSHRSIVRLRREAFEQVKKTLKNSADRQKIEWLEAWDRELDQIEHGKGENRVWFSPGMNCPNAIVKQLKKARHQVKICVFTISDNLISDQLVACQKRGVKVKIITDNDKTHDAGSDIHWLVKKDIEIRTDKSRHHMHHKFAVIDNQTAITGSYNWTRSAREYNQENIVVTTNAAIVKSYEKQFDRLWKQMKKY